MFRTSGFSLTASTKPGSDRIGSDRTGSDRTGSDRISNRITDRETEKSFENESFIKY